ncbi:MAG: small multi-drug export protein [Candidatus Aenigmatarchaeota archaeon]
MTNGINETIAIIIASILPISELRGGIPLGMVLGLNPLFVIITAIIFNSLVFFPVYFGLNLFYDKFLYKIEIVQKNLKRISKSKDKIEKYGIIGLALFVAVPFPFTGAWTGSVLAWLLRLEWKKSFLAILLGVIIAGAIVSILSLGIFNLVRFA